MANTHARVTVRERLCIESRPEPCGLVLFGASGDLAHRKIMPSLAGLYAAGLLPPAFYVLGCGRTQMNDDEFRAGVAQALEGIAPDAQSEFIARCHYETGQYDDPAFYTSLGQRLAHLDRLHTTHQNHLFYLSIPPSVYCSVVKLLGAQGLTREHTDHSGWVRVAVEKPHGRDLTSAMDLAQELRSVLSEEQIYRMDHYLGKETVQNIAMFRFANAVFEPIWNHHHIDHVQITVAEADGVGERAGYFEQAGMLRDMVQNHMMQLLALVAMEPPSMFTGRHMHDEKAKLLQAVRPFDADHLEHAIIRAQYGPGERRGTALEGYREERNVAPDSQMETFVAARLLIDNHRWRGVPFYFRTGKRLHCKKTEIAVAFKHVPHSIFPSLEPDDLVQNLLVFNVQPDEGISLTIQAKKPGPKLCMCDLNLDVAYRDVFHAAPPEAYERLLLDCMLGDQMLFTREDTVEASWALVTPVLAAWEDGRVPLHTYPAGTWGPAVADMLPAHEGREWRDLCAWCRNRNLHHA